MAEVTFQPGPSPSLADSFNTGMERRQSMMQRSAQLRQAQQMEQIRNQQIAENAILAPLTAAKTQADIAKAKTDWDSALQTQEVRKGAYAMKAKADADFDYLNQIEDASERAAASREWISRYSQLANVKELEPEMKAKRELAFQNVSDLIKLNMIGGAEMASFNALRKTAGLDAEGSARAAKVKLGLEGRASSAGKKSETLTLPDGRKVEMVFDPQSGGYSIPQVAQLPATGHSTVNPTDSNPFVSQTTFNEAQQKEAGQKDAELTAKLKADKPKRTQALSQAEVSSNRLVDDIDDIIGKVTASTAGPGGVLLDKFPGTSARDLEANLNSIKANIGFQALQAMREASPTGGALGQVSDVENKLLQSQLGTLEIGQSPKQLISNLKKVQSRIRENYGILRAGYSSQYGDAPDEVGPTGTSGIKEMSDADLEKRLKELHGQK